MADFSNAQKLAAIVTEWSRPAIAQIAASKMASSIGWLKSIQDSVIALGIVGSNYDIKQDIQPLMMPVINAIVEPMLVEQFSKIPDAAIPMMARNIIEEIRNKGSMSLLDGLIVLDQSDVNELQNLVERNLPCDNVEPYKVIR